MATSYSNPNGTGDRRSTITVTTTLSVSGSPSVMVDGSTVGTSFFFGTQGVSGQVIKFDFLSGNSFVIDEATFYESPGNAQGTWQWQGSPDNSTWTSIGSSFTLGGVTPPQILTSLNGNTQDYRYYQLLGVSGTTNNGPWIIEMEFQIGPVISTNPSGTFEADGSATGTFGSSVGDASTASGVAGTSFDGLVPFRAESDGTATSTFDGPIAATFVANGAATVICTDPDCEADGLGTGSFFAPSIERGEADGVGTASFSAQDPGATAFNGVASVSFFGSRTIRAIQTGLARIAAPPPTTRTQTGIAHIVIGRAQTGVSNIRAATNRTLAGKAAVVFLGTHNQSGVANIRAAVSRNQTGITRIATNRDQVGKANIVIITQANKTITGIAHIAALTNRVQQGKAFIQAFATTQQNLTGIARVMGLRNALSATVLSITGKGAVVTAIPGIIGKTPGMWTVGREGGRGGVPTTPDSFASSNKVIQDSRYWQDFSYDLQFGETLNRYRDVLKRLLHPAGLAMFGSILIQSRANTSSLITGTIQLYRRDLTTKFFPNNLRITEEMNLTLAPSVPIIGSTNADLDALKFFIFPPYEAFTQRYPAPNQNYWTTEGPGNTQIANFADMTIGDVIKFPRRRTIVAPDAFIEIRNNGVRADGRSSSMFTAIDEVVRLEVDGASDVEFVITVDTPQPDIPAGSYSTAQLVTLSSVFGNTIYYTTDGSTPTTASTLYTGPISVSVSETIKAIATAPGAVDSAIGSAAYIISSWPGAPGTVRNNLLAEYLFQEGSGQIAHDTSGNGLDGVLGLTSSVEPGIDPTWP